MSADPQNSAARSAAPIAAAASSAVADGERPYDAAFMAQAVAQAELGRGRTSPNPLVGALVVDESGSEPVVLARGYHVGPGRDHAEVAALRHLDGRAPGKTLYVTLEPCNHIGRTGKCTDAVLAAGLRRVVVGLRDPNPRVTGGGIERLRSAGVEVTVLLGESAEACRHQNRGYVRWLKDGRPQLQMKAAISLDGRLAPASAPIGPGGKRAPQWLTGAQARARAHQLRDHADAILVGAGTVESDDPLLTVRLPGSERGGARQPLRVVLDGALRTRPEAQLCGPGTLIITSEAAHRARVEQVAALRGRGVELLALPGAGAAEQLDLHEVLRALARRDVLFVMCEGGGFLHGALLSAGLYDEAALFVAPIFLGDSAVPLGRGLAVGAVADAPWLDRVQVEALGPDTLITGQVRSGGFAPRESTEPVVS